MRSTRRRKSRKLGAAAESAPKKAKRSKKPKAAKKERKVVCTLPKVKAERRTFEKKESVPGAMDIALSFPRVEPKAVDSHLEPGNAFYTGKMLDTLQNKPCTPEKGRKGLGKGKLELAFFSGPQSERYNKANPNSPQIQRPGPVLRLCEGISQPRVLPVENFEDALVKAKAFRKCVRADGKSEASCISEVAGGASLGLGRSPKRRKSRR